LDFRKLAEEYLYEQLQRESMTPEEIEHEKKMKRLQELEDQEKSRTEEEEQKRIKVVQEQYAKKFDQTITEALKQSGLPKTPSSVKRMAQMLSKNIELGLELDPEDLVEEVRGSYFKEFKEIFESADVDFILSILGDDISNKIRKRDIEKLRTVPQHNKAENQDSSKPAPKTEKGYMTPDEYKEYLDKKING
jgi:hypothetical protein